MQLVVERRMSRALPKALIIESNGVIGLELTDLLDTEAGCSVCAVVSTARAAIDAIAEHQPDLVIADLRVITAQGFSLEAISHGHHRLVVVTGDQQSADEHVRDGTPCLMKPFSGQALLHEVTEALRYTQPSQ